MMISSIQKDTIKRRNRDYIIINKTQSDNHLKPNKGQLRDKSYNYH